ncbi:hypothetical protein AB0B66_40675 [Catellatospora sp. NPDC049111]|uniref:hypothetical protein n=1 Tax=Catellatospora sp. NPDC049111 TaxID=3155271 RepID=UPI0033D74B4B
MSVQQPAWRGTASAARSAGLALAAVAGLALAAVVLVDAIMPRVGVPARAYVITAAVLALYLAAKFAVAALTRWRVVVHIDEHEMRVRSWPVPMHTTIVAVDAIHEVRTVDAGPARAGASWWLTVPPDGRHVLRPGPALQLVLSSARTVTVSLDHPERALAALGEPIRPRPL